uniref:Uncharacterized protein n=1 Tax=Panagrolaimus sp. PS1159 TaxID=55785 RepID=A0AC35F5R2_9BILA
MGAEVGSNFLIKFPSIADSIGIETDKEKYSIQTRIAESQKLWSKVNFINDDFRNQKKVVSKADFIVINDLPEIFPSENEQVKCWQKLKECLKSQAIILHTSSLRKEIKNLELGWEIEEWLEQLDTRQIGNDYLLDSHLAVGCYGAFEVFRVR